MERTSWCFLIALCTCAGYVTDVAARCSSAPRPHVREIRGMSDCARRSTSARSTYTSSSMTPLEELRRLEQAERFSVTVVKSGGDFFRF